VVEAVRHMRAVQGALKRLTILGAEELMAEAKELGAPYELVQRVAKTGTLPVPNFAAGGIATPADASLMMQLGAEAIFVGSGVFKSGDPERRGKAIVQATTHYLDAELVARVSEDLGEAMVGIDISRLEPGELLQTRGW
jgi:pyridoxal 5'-phosphate synthase pdxS subunit